jgi:hypothetical protein
MNSSGSPFLSLSAVILGLRGSVGGWSVRGWLQAALGLLLYRRLGQICGRMERMAARFAAGRLWRRERVARGEPQVSVEAGSGRPAVGERIWPLGFGWLVKAAGWQAAGYGSQLRAVLATPEMVALLTAAPQAAIVLRPLCRMLAIETSVLRPGRVDEDVAAAVVDAPKRVRKPRAKVDWGGFRYRVA